MSEVTGIVAARSIPTTVTTADSLSLYLSSHSLHFTSPSYTMASGHSYQGYGHHTYHTVKRPLPQLPNLTVKGFLLFG